MAGWKAFITFGLAVSAAFLLAPTDGLLQAGLYITMSGAAVVALVAGVRRHRPEPAGAWRVLIGASALYWVAVVGWALHPVLSGRPLPFPSILDLLFWGAYLGWFSFLVVVVRVHTRGDRSAVLDALVVAAGVAALGWETLIAPALDPALPTAVAIASVTYPVLLTALAAVAVRAAVASVRFTVVHGLLVAWIGLELVGDVWYGLASAAGSFHFGSPWSVTWLLGYTALGALALHPRMGTVTAPADGGHVATRRTLIIVLGVAGLLPMAALMVRASREGTPSDTIIIGAVTIAIFVAIMVRLGRSTTELADERDLRGQLEHAARHDDLTGLVNRVGFDAVLRRGLAARHADDRATMVIVADLDGFKAVNDTYGHEAGDELLREVARRLCDGVRAGDTVGRLGGDEFAVVIDDIDPVEGLALADRLAAAVAAPIRIGPAIPAIGVSLGVYRVAPGDDPDEALRHADAAMYAAKVSGGGVELFDADHHRGLLDRYRLQLQLRAAPAAGELVLHYQPLYRLSDRVIIGAEALVRWQHPDRGWLAPDAFIELAEESGAILDIDRWVLQQACQAAAAWQRIADGVGVSVNLSRRHLQGSGVVRDVADALDRSGLPARLLTLEITETAVTVDVDAVIEVMRDLAALGVKLAMDDFGTGYSSLADLRRMPIDMLKIDRAFVSGIARTEEEWALAAAILRLASSLGKRTLGEGIEDAGQLAHLRSLGCQLGQGYLFARPMPVTELLELLRVPADVR